MCSPPCRGRISGPRATATWTDAGRSPQVDPGGGLAAAGRQRAEPAAVREPVDLGSHAGAAADRRADAAAHPPDRLGDRRRVSAQGREDVGRGGPAVLRSLGQAGQLPGRSPSTPRPTPPPALCSGACSCPGNGPRTPTAGPSPASRPRSRTARSGVWPWTCSTPSPPGA